MSTRPTVALTQDTLADENVLISAIHPIRNIVLSDGGEAVELLGNIVDSEPELIKGLRAFVDAGWKQYACHDDKEDGDKDLGDLPGYEQSEILRDWGYRNIPGDLLIAAVSAPVPKYHNKKETSYSFSWGYTFTGFVKGATLEELYTAALKWKDGRYADERAAA